MDLQLFTKWYVKYIIFGLLCLLLLVVPIMKGPWIGTESFLYHRLASEFSFYDSLSYGGRLPGYAFANALILILSPTFLMSILPFVFGILSFYLLSRIYSHFIPEVRWKNLTLLMTIFSPTYIYIFSFYNSLTLATFLSILAFYIFINKKWKYLVIPLALILPFCNIAITLCFYVLLLLFVLFLKKDRRALFFWSFLISLIAILIYYGILVWLQGFPSFFTPPINESFYFFKAIFFDLGSAYGLSLFIILLSIIGAIGSWSKKYSSPFYFLAITIFFVLSFFVIESLVILSFLLSVLAALGLIKLFELRWTNHKYKSFITMIFLLGLIFSPISQVNYLIDSMPNEKTLDAIEYLSTLEPSVVLSEPSNGVWINFAGHENVIDENYLFAPSVEERYYDIQNLYTYRDLENSTNIINKYDVEYIWIDPEMREEIWDSDSEGLLFVLQYTKFYYTMYNKDGMQIWRITEL